MRLPVRMNIENRIFYPFLLIFLLFTALFGSVLYYNSYRSLLGQQNPPDGRGFSTPAAGAETSAL